MDIFTPNRGHSFYITLVLSWKNLEPPIQIPRYGSNAPSLGTDDSQMPVGFLGEGWKGRRSFELIGALSLNKYEAFIFDQFNL